MPDLALTLPWPGLHALLDGDPSRALTLGVGILLLLFGRRLFWLAVAAAGFLAGSTLTLAFLPELSPALTLGIGLAVGALGALVAVVAQAVAVVLAGFVLGGVAGAQLLPLLELGDGWPALLCLLLPGLAVAAAAHWLLALALRLVTSGAGAALLVLAVGLAPPVQLVAFGALWLLGFVAQRERS